MKLHGLHKNYFNVRVSLVVVQMQLGLPQLHFCGCDRVDVSCGCLYDSMLW